ncbi:MAG: response regulator, partial [Planctomycetota bacterium]
RTLAREIDDLALERHRRQIAALARQPELAATLMAGPGSGPGPNIQSVLDTARSLSAANAIYLLDADGLVIACCDHPRRDRFLGFRFNYRPYFSEALKGEVTVFLALGATTGEMGVYFGAPVCDGEGTVRGVVAMKSGIAPIRQRLRRAAGDARLALIDERGIVFAASDPKLRFASFGSLSPAVWEEIRATRQWPDDLIRELDVGATGLPPGAASFRLGSDRAEAVPLGMPLAWRVVALAAPASAWPLYGAITLVVLALGSALTTVSALAQRRVRLQQRIAAQAEDIDAARREAVAVELRYRQILDALADPVVVYAEDGDPIWVNAAYRRFFGRDDGLSRRDLGSDDEARSGVTRERVHTSVAGEQRRFEISQVAAEDGGARLEVAVLHDITELRRVTDRLAELNEQLEQRVRERTHDLEEEVRERKSIQQQLLRAERLGAIGQLASGVAHDFNNILMGVVGCAEVIQSSAGADEEIRAFATRIIDASQRAGILTRQLLAFSRQGVLRREVVDLNRLARESMAILSRTIDPNIEIRCQLAEGELAVEGDPAQLASAVLNLAVNARDAMPGAGVLTIASGQQRLLEPTVASDGCTFAPGSYVWLAVSDTGSGMEPETLSRVFDPFFTTKGVGEGTGLGLAAASGTLHDHGGGITVESRPGAGSRFTIHLPACAQGVTGPEVEPAAAAPGSGCVLVIEDEPIIRLILERMLGRLGYEVHLAENGEAGVKEFTARQAAVSAVLLDVVMPGMGGLETFRRLRQIDPAVAVIVSSGFSTEGETRQMLDEGAVGYIQKPYQLDDLAEALRKVLDGKG